MKSITELYQAHSLPAAVIGGSPSALKDIECMPPDCIIISANHHAYRAGLIPDYYVFKDDPRQHKHLMERVLRPEGAKVISTKEKYTDYNIDVYKWDRGYTGHLSLWLSQWITTPGTPTIICGMDCYTGKEHYFDNENAGSYGGNRTLDIYLRQWQLALGEDPKDKGLPRPEDVYVVSGVLTKIFKKWR